MTIRMPSDKKLEQVDMESFNAHKYTLNSFILRMPTKGKIVSPVFMGIDDLGVVKPEDKLKANSKK